MSRTRSLVVAAATLLPFCSRAADTARFSLEQILSAPFAADLVTATDRQAFAWVSNARGRRNVWLAQYHPGDHSFQARALTHYSPDDGLDVSELAFVPKHDALLFVRGGDAEYPDKPAANPAQIPSGVEHEVYRVDFGGHA